MKTILYIHEFLPPVIATRKSIAIIKNEVEKFQSENIIVFDFSNIILISRSFANEIIQFAKSKPGKIEFSNLNNNILLIMKSVENTWTAKNKTYDNIPVTYFNNNAELFEFLATV
jgi:hypothetical protein